MRLCLGIHSSSTPATALDHAALASRSGTGGNLCCCHGFCPFIAVIVPLCDRIPHLERRQHLMQDSVRIEHCKSPRNREQLHWLHTRSPTQRLSRGGNKASLHLTGLQRPQLQSATHLWLPPHIQVEQHSKAPPITCSVVDVLLEPPRRRGVNRQHCVTVLTDVSQSWHPPWQQVHNECVHSTHCPVKGVAVVRYHRRKVHPQDAVSTNVVSGHLSAGLRLLANPYLSWLKEVVQRAGLCKDAVHNFWREEFIYVCKTPGEQLLGKRVGRGLQVLQPMNGVHCSHRQLLLIRCLALLALLLSALG
mmetsp:Transcript_17663/g.49393  ORF Transcript_17663/g.49393 Transcript_17663/m.49393 type:complete len:305 (+) Transcript_17663:288-1202(+)